MDKTEIESVLHDMKGAADRVEEQAKYLKSHLKTRSGRLPEANTLKGIITSIQFDIEACESHVFAYQRARNTP